MYDDAGHAAIVRDYAKLALNDRLGTLGDDYALAAGGYQDLGRWFDLMAQVQPEADPLEWETVAGELSRLNGLYKATPLEKPLRARTAAILSPVLARIGFEPKPEDGALVSNLRETLIGQLGTSGDAMVAARARGYVAALAKNPNAIPGPSASRSWRPMRPARRRPNGIACTNWPRPSAIPSSRTAMSRYWGMRRTKVRRVGR